MFWMEGELRNILVGVDFLLIDDGVYKVGGVEKRAFEKLNIKKNTFVVINIESNSTKYLELN